MKPQTIDNFTGPVKPSGDQLCYRNCPECGDGRWKVYVNPETGTWICFTCDDGRGRGRGRVRVGLEPDDLYRRLAPVPSGPRVLEEWPEVEWPTWTDLSTKASEYLYNRTITTIEANSLCMEEGAENLQGRILVPFFDRGNRLIYWSARDYTGNSKQKYMVMGGRHPLYVPMMLTFRAPTLIVVEGVFDAIRVWQAGFDNVVALCGKSLPKYLEQALLDLVTERVDILLDQDAMGPAMKMARQLESRIDVAVHTCPEKDPGACSLDQIKELFNHAV